VFKFRKGCISFGTNYFLGLLFVRYDFVEWFRRYGRETCMVDSLGLSSTEKVSNVEKLCAYEMKELRLLLFVKVTAQ